MNLSLYCNCYRNRINKKIEYSQKNLMLGSISYESDLKSKLFNEGFIFDDLGDNISHLNKWFGQLSGLYWVWKNTDEEIIGTNTYRLFWGDYFLKNDLQSNTLYVPKPGNLVDYFGKDSDRNNVYDQYSYCHGEINLNLLDKLAKNDSIKIKSSMIEELKQQNFLYNFNIFVSERKIFNQVCEILFEILFEFYFQYRNIFLEIEKTYHQNRILDFLGERILHIIYTHLDYYFSGLNIITVPITVLNHSF